MRPKILIGILILLFVLAAVLLINKSPFTKKAEEPKPGISSKAERWIAPDTSSIPANEEGDLIRLGRKLITNTSEYLGPKGSVAHISNGMNCQNCHIDAGTKSFGNNFSMVANSYPKFRERSGKMESVEFRVNDCMERSLNGKPLDSLSREMRALVAYLKWVGKDVPKEKKLDDAAVEKLKFLARPADTIKGKALYLTKCITCHGKDGHGIPKPDASGYIYPPLWGENSFNIGAGMYRITRMAGYIKNNMPLGSTYENPQLSSTEAWDIAAYILSKPRPVKDLEQDWPKLHSKPFDYPFGPYANQFSESQHKYGPFDPIRKADSLITARLKNSKKVF